MSDPGKAIVAAYVLLTLALVAMWQQGSVEGIGIVAAFIVGLAALASGGLTRFKAGEPGVATEIERVIERIEAAATVAVDPGAAEGTTGQASEQAAQQAEAERHRALDVLVRDAATWGWLKANLGSPTPPEPLLEWDRDGNARLVYDDPAALRRQMSARRPPAVERARRVRGGR